MSRFKIIFSGPAGAGKSAAIAAISDVTPVNALADADAADRNRASATNVGMEHGTTLLSDGSTLHLYGTTGEEPLEAARDTLMAGSTGLVLLIDGSREDPLADLVQFVGTFERFIAGTGLAIGVTHADRAGSLPLKEMAELLQQSGFGTVPVFEVDARDRRDVSMLIEALLNLNDPVAQP
ncbi:MAG: hypothetical protein KDG52_07895 [Rhodocyclaceae bacterium]|nr:hypothetical protein [Rhodocyclaceae bacterium]